MRIKLIRSKLLSHDDNSKQTNAHHLHVFDEYDVILIKDMYKSTVTSCGMKLKK
jgi:hypothetical protein